jgi:hypothetical protein
MTEHNHYFRIFNISHCCIRDMMAPELTRACDEVLLLVGDAMVAVTFSVRNNTCK